ncbi:MAG TPA: hypothetical protein PK079_18010 [Leptospiraceae bacterium]|nr:hypothetical protein [Leptospiraceae bacterium]HMW07970.1 hypothetical protein [Leptospiraceae bacterium]HMX35109.1 hypothetical protein [Leptospiraceae bacterium]HMY34064.1 hypothetical protein [Leptospiraceae bacterium]HMZ65731.1 hypothetical protein [Leptospiraceae bacterium]
MKKIVIILFLFIFTCIGQKGAKIKSIFSLSNTTLSNSKDLRSFQFLQISPPVTATISGNQITAIIPSSISVKNLVATLDTTGNSILANGVLQVNGQTPNDFTNPIVYSIVAADGTKSDFTVTVNNTGYFILGSAGNINITGLSASDSALEMYYDTSGNSFKSFSNNTMIGAILPANTQYALRFKSQPTGRVCSLTGGSLSGTLTADVSFSINCVTGYLVGGKVLAVLSTFTIPANGATVTTVAGSFPPTASAGSSDGVGSAARFSFVLGITSDGKDLYVGDAGNHCIRKYEIATANVTTIAGLCGTSGTTDGTGTFARFNFPMQIASDGTNLFICDRANNMIRKVVISTGVVTTLIGSGGASGDQEGIGSVARINFPNGITTDGNYIYVSDRGNNKIKRMLLSSEIVSTIAGNGIAATVDSANGLTASLDTPCDSVSVGTSLYFVDCFGHTLRKIELSGSFAVTTLAGSGAAATTDGTGLAASFNNPHGIETDGSNLFITEYNGQYIRRVGISSLNVVTIAGGVGYQDGTGASALLGNLGGISTDGNRLYFVDSSNNAIRRIDNPPD